MRVKATKGEDLLAFKVGGPKVPSQIFQRMTGILGGPLQKPSRQTYDAKVVVAGVEDLGWVVKYLEVWLATKCGYEGDQRWIGVGWVCMGVGYRAM